MTPAPDEHQLDLHRRLLEGLRDDPYLRFELDPGTLEHVRVRDGVAGAWIGRHSSGVRWATGLALDPDDPSHLEAAAALLADVAGPTLGTGSEVRGVTITRGGLASSRRLSASRSRGSGTSGAPATSHRPQPWRRRTATQLG